MKDLFSKRTRSKPSTSDNTFQTEIPLSEDLEISTCPPGLYCVIDEFLTEYDLRLLEEEERAEIVAKKRKVNQNSF